MHFKLAYLICSEVLKDHLKPGMKALDVGSGSGYLTACMALMVGPRGTVVGIGKNRVELLVKSCVADIFCSISIKDRMAIFKISTGVFAKKALNFKLSFFSF
jgi:predicted methyltransferase